MCLIAQPVQNMAGRGMAQKNVGCHGIIRRCASKFSAELQSKMFKEMATQEERKSQLVAFKVPETEGETDREHNKTELRCLNSYAWPQWTIGPKLFS
jgi:hypothetical protein